MIVRQTELEGVFEIQLQPHNDKRGFFVRTYAKDIFSKHGIDRNWVQENHSRSTKKGIIRGLHFQFPPYAETKLVRCVRGAILDVYLDLRKGSRTFGKHGSIELSENNKKMIYIPRGFAHGFCTLDDISEVLYKVDNHYNPQAEGGIIWNDKQLRIPWPVEDPVLSEKDAQLMTYEQFIAKHGGLDVAQKQGVQQ